MAQCGTRPGWVSQAEGCGFESHCPLAGNAAQHMSLCWAAFPRTRCPRPVHAIFHAIPRVYPGTPWPWVAHKPPMVAPTRALGGPLWASSESWGWVGVAGALLERSSFVRVLAVLAGDHVPDCLPDLRERLLAYGERRVRPEVVLLDGAELFGLGHAVLREAEFTSFEGNAVRQGAAQLILLGSDRHDNGVVPSVQLFPGDHDNKPWLSTVPRDLVDIPRIQSSSSDSYHR